MSLNGRRSIGVDSQPVEFCGMLYRANWHVNFPLECVSLAHELAAFDPLKLKLQGGVSHGADITVGELH